MGPEPRRAGAERTATTASGVLRVCRREERYRELLRGFFVLMKAAQIGADNVGFQVALVKFLEVLDERLSEEGTLNISERDGKLFVNAVQARVNASWFGAQRYLVRTLLRNGFAGILFDRGVTIEELCEFVTLLLDTRPRVGAFDDALQKHGVTHIRTMPRSNLVQPLLEKADRGGSYFQQILVLRHLLGMLGDFSMIERRHTRGILRGFVTYLLDNDDARPILDLIRRSRRSEPLPVIRTALLAAAVAERLGYDRQGSIEFGLAALGQGRKDHLREFDAVLKLSRRLEEVSRSGEKRLEASLPTVLEELGESFPGRVKRATLELVAP